MKTAQREVTQQRPAATVVMQQVKGDGNLNLAVGGIYHAGDQYIQKLYRDSDFHEPSLKLVEPPGFESPPIAEQLVQHLFEKRLLVLGGDRLPDKPTLALHLAWLLQKRLEGDPRGRTTVLEVKECVCGSGAIRLDTVLRGEQSPTLFILQRAEPSHLGNNLEALLRTVNPLQHYLIVTTDTDLSSWMQASEPKTIDVWREFEAREVYGETYLAHCLHRRLGAAAGKERPGLFPGDRPGGWDEDLDLPLVEGLSLRQAARELRTPDQVGLLVSWLTSGSEPVLVAGVRQEIQGIHAEDAAIGSWYQHLSPHAQRLVVGLLLFEGLFDDQLFGALDVLVQEIWRPRLPSLESFEYKDLEAVVSYFRLPETEHGGIRVEARSPEHGKALFDAVWRFRRRDLLATLPAILWLVKTSGNRAAEEEAAEEEKRNGAAAPNADPPKGAEEKSKRADAKRKDTGTPTKPGGEQVAPKSNQESAALSRWERYGPIRELVSSSERRERLDEVLSRSLGQIAMRSPAVVESCLLELAGHESEGAHAVTARALGGLLGSVRESYVLDLLLEWNKDAREKQSVFLSRKENQEKDLPEQRRYVAIRATTAQVLASAAFELPAGRLPEPCVRLLEQLAEDWNLEVRRQLRFQALPALVMRHQRQLDSVLWEILRYGDLIEPVAFGWAQAHEQRPADAAKLLEEWQARCVDDVPTPSTELPVQREARMSVVALTHGFVDYRSPAAQASLEAAVGKLKRMLNERHPFVRRHVFRAIGMLIRGYFERLESSLRELVEGVGIEDRNEIVAPLVGIYLSQRQALQGGQLHLEVDGVSYQVWRGKDRPSTRLENILQRWLTDPDHASAQQIALEAFVAFYGCPLAEAEEKWRLAGAPVTGEEEPAAATPVPARRGPVQSLREVPILDRGILFLLTAGRMDLKSVLKALVAEMVFELNGQRVAVRRLLRDWRQRRGRLGTLGRHLGYQSFFHRYWPLLVLLIVIGGLMVFDFWLKTTAGGVK
ncbi:MAG TPA: hypothetical protein VGS22_22780 [Thermoanaerobaculia bacterium]|jgi:hypothetical protein|nr:hypothetical protein [Thermoanaerobaculia bacterium]